MCTRIALFGISIHYDVRDFRHDLLDQTISQHGHSLMIILHSWEHTHTYKWSARMLGCICVCWVSGCSGTYGYTSISFWAMLQAAPSPTASGVGTVPERSPLSCPPPFCSGSKRTLGRRRTYKAPTPVHTHTHSLSNAQQWRLSACSGPLPTNASTDLWVHRSYDRWWTSGQSSSQRHWWELFQQPEQHQCVKRLL